MKIGILTFQWYDNYGTSLQAYGLQTALMDLGLDAHIVRLKGCEKYGINRFVSKSFVGLRKKWGKFLQEYGFRRHRQFREFRRKNFRYDGNRELEFDEVIKGPLAEDALVFGSDNIWSPWCCTLGSPIARLFYGNNIKHDFKVVYAASSTGCLADHPRYEEVIGLVADAGFKAISLREKVNVELFRQHGLPASFVPDPTLLLTRDEWTRIETQPTDAPPGDYIFGYDLGHVGVISVKEACERFAAAGSRLSMRIPYPEHFWRDRAVACTPGPAEWLWYIHHAKLVVTNSFHGVMFSLIFNTPFVYVPVAAEDSTVNMRTFDILDTVGMRDRRAMPFESSNEIELPQVDWTAVNGRIAVFRQQGIDYLMGALSR